MRRTLLTLLSMVCGLVILAAAQTSAATVLVTSDITTSETWAANNEYILTQVIYVTNGATLTIEPGTVVRGEGESSPGANDPGTLVITRGSKIQVLGTKQAPVVFTDSLDDNVGASTGTAPYDTALNALSLNARWGGLILLGRTYVANDTLTGPLAAREVQIEGLTAAGGLGLYGNGGDDDDDSGSIRYLSIRYGGFNLSPNNEINGLTMGAVGRGTDVDHVEIFQNKDDGVEFFGGTVGVKNLIVANVGDDSVDYDEGFRGKGQFIFVMQGTPGTDKSDKGAEQDGGNNPDGSQPYGMPTFHNVTMVGLGQKAFTNASANTALHFRDNAGGHWYNSAFLDFGGATTCIEGDPTDLDSSGARFATAMTTGVCTPFSDPPVFCNSNVDCGGGSCVDFFGAGDSTNQLELEDNDFWCFGNGSAIPSDSVSAPVVGCDAKDHYGDADGVGIFTNAALDNSYAACAAANPISALSRFPTGVPTIPDPVISIDPRPAPGSSLLTTNRIGVDDGFFETVQFKGAFSETTNWAEGWSTMSRLGYFPAVTTVHVSADVTISESWTADTEYILTRPIYVRNGATLTIEPGTVIRGEGESSPGANDPGTLIVTRGSKIKANGNADAPIVFTDLLDDNIGANPGTAPYDTALNALSLNARWGGLILLGRTYVANDTLTGPLAAREVQIEGLTAAGGLGLYGNGGDDDDDSGDMSYVSIRYGGFNLSPNNEINGLTLGAVGRSTSLHHVEIFQNKDDGVEFFGGTVGVQNLIVANVGDDSVDYDEGFRGKGQFIFVMQGTPGTDKSDKGAEQDGANNPDGSQPYGMPTFYNVTMVGLGQKAFTNAATNTALHFRDNAGGHYYNSAFLDFGGATMCVEGDPADLDSSGARFTTAITSGTCSGGGNPPTFCNEDADCPATETCDDYFFAGDAANQLELQDNDFWCFGNGSAIPDDAVSAPVVGCDAKDHYGDADGVGIFTNPALGNSYAACALPAPIAGLSRFATGVPTIPDPVISIDPRPNSGSSLLATDRTPPIDGFFKPANYKGAFSQNDNWAAGWSTMSRLGYFPQDNQVLVSADISTSQTWTKDNEYILAEVIYVRDGATLTIEPGTVVRGQGESSPGANDPGTLVITRGSKIDAVGTSTMPIVFTDLLDDNLGDNPGTAPYDTALNALSLNARWGGVIVLGRTYVANDTLSGPNAGRQVQIEGLTAAGGLGLYGNGGDDDDDSGDMSYVSIRYGGFNLSPNNEINGLTLGAVGRSTNLHHLEVFQNKDDGVEFFGGTVGVKNLIVANVGDDSVDYDEGFRGKGQFVFVMQGTPGTDKSDKGAEQDGANNPDGSQPYGIPTFHNVTMVGLGQKGFTNAATNTALHFRDNAGGRYYNSAFLDFGGATTCIEGDPTDLDSAGARFATPMTTGICTPFADPPTFCNTNADCGGGTCVDFFAAGDSTNQLELEDNDFWCFGNGSAIPDDAVSAPVVGCDAKDHYGDADGVGIFTNAALDNSYASCAAANPIAALSRFATGVPTIPDPVISIDPRPAAGSSLLTTNRTSPVDGFFDQVGYKGAFSEAVNWASGWSTMSRLGYFPSTDVIVDSNITTSETWTANNTYVLDSPIYVENGATLTIEPGTVVRGEGESSPGANDPGTLIVTRGSKINAVGSPDAPIVFTDLLDDNFVGTSGTAPYDTALNALSLNARWGGVILLGRTYVANDTLTGPLAAREVQIEGLTAAGGLGLYGNGGDDDDDSGDMSYVSIRYGGFNLSPNNEINGLTLGAVGRSTNLHHLEVFQNKDDGVEFFGGTVGVKNLIVANVGDDSVDYDEGFRGKGQFVFVMQGTPGTDKSDKGAEQDGANNPDGSQPYGIPTFHNVTMVGLGQKGFTNAATNTALHFRDNAGGHYYNSAFLDFGGATMCIEGDPADLDSSGARFTTAMTSGICSGLGDPPMFCNADADCPGVETCLPFFDRLDATNQLELEDNDFWCFGNGSAIPDDAVSAPVVGCDAKDHYGDADGVGIFTNAALDNTYSGCATPLPIHGLQRFATGVPTIPDPVIKIDPRPYWGSTLLDTDRGNPGDAFFEPTPYKGAFSHGNNWAAGWSTMANLGYFPGCNNVDEFASPNEVGLLSWGPFKNQLSWTAPLGADGTEVYDVLRTRGTETRAANGFDNAFCVEVNDGSDTDAVDKDAPTSGEVFFYLVRAGNSCAEGSLGNGSESAHRTNATTCN